MLSFMMRIDGDGFYRLHSISACTWFCHKGWVN